jgi:hypothetical protein
VLFLSIYIRRGCCWPSPQLPSEAAHLSLLSPARQKLLYTTLDRFLYFIGRPAREKVFFFFFPFFFLRNDDGAGASILVISKEREEIKGVDGLHPAESTTLIQFLFFLTLPAAGGGGGQSCWMKARAIISIRAHLFFSFFFPVKKRRPFILIRFQLLFHFIFKFVIFFFSLEMISSWMISLGTVTSLINVNQSSIRTSK